MKRRLLAGGLALAAVAAAVVLAPPGEARLDRSFGARARAYPVEPDPGQNQLSLSMRPLSADAAVAGPPASSFGRAAMLDTGFAENHPAARPPEESTARCDTVAADVPDESERTHGAVHLRATCSTTPTAATTVEGVSLVPFGLEGGVVVSRADTDGSGPATAVIESSATDVAVGPLTIAEARFRAAVAADGTPGGASAEVDVEVVGATVAGVPVVVTRDGVEVDATEVPAPLLAEAGKAVQQAFASPYSDVRLVTPAVEVDPDGRHAEVRGGGIKLMFQSSDDPSDRRFFGVTILGGTATVTVGKRAAGSEVDRPAAGGVVGSGRGGPASRPMAVAPGSLSRPPASGAPPASPSPGPALAGDAGMTLTAASGTRGLPSGSSLWLVVLVTGAAGLALVAASGTPALLPARRRAERWWDEAAERYWRG